MIDFDADVGYPNTWIRIILLCLHHDIIALNTERRAYGFIESSDG